uniref:Ubiquitin-like protease family profile domain-containing protein n=1 Tax=viral metagenome TaxID=1070528 RepID=A0A6C0BE09_9ZZZZ
MDGDDDFNDIEDNNTEIPIYQADLDYNTLDINNLLNQLGEDGYINRKVENKYQAFEHYKQIFHFSLVKNFGIDTLFLDNSENRPYSQYNCISIKDSSNIDVLTSKFLNIINSVDDTICIFLDFQSLRFKNNWHTTLLIYRPQKNCIEHYDPNGAFNFGDVVKFDNLIENLKVLKDLIFISSLQLHSFNMFNKEYSRNRSLNNICNLHNKDHPGWCQIWSLFIYEMIVRYPKMTTKQIIDTIFMSLKGIKNKEVSIKVLNIINGYYILLILRANEIITDNSLKLSFDSLAEFNSEYVINDIKMNRLIEEYMRDKLFSCFY